MLPRHVFRTAGRMAGRRGFAAAAAAAADKQAQPPISMFGLDGTYASALYTAASKSSTLDATARSLASLQTLLERDAKLQPMLATPALTDEDKKTIVGELARHAGSNDAVRNLLTAMADNNRLSLLTHVCDKFAQIMAAARGEVAMTVTSAQPLDNKTLSRLESAVSKSSYVGQGQKLKVKNEINPDILGGLVVEIGDRTIDLSVSSRIAKMNNLLVETV